MFKGLENSRLRMAHLKPDDEFSGSGKIIICLFVFCFMLIVGSLALLRGAYDIFFWDVCRVLASHVFPFLESYEVSKIHDTIVWNTRLPRILLAMMVGISLAAAGAVYQGCFRNPLVDPFILGVSSGAAFGAGLGIIMPSFFLSIQMSAFLFSLIAVAATYLLARMGGKTPAVTLILAGVIIASLFEGLVSILKYLASDTALRTIVFWIMGGFYFAGWNDLIINVPIILGSFLVLWFYGWKINIISMGDDEARTMGVNPEKLKIILVVLATLMTSVAVSTVGIIAWVGLMMPHAARMILGPDHRYVIPLSAMLGAIYLVICDTLARTLTTSEIPVGIITSILGAPYLFYLLRTKGKRLFG